MRIYHLQFRQRREEFAKDPAEVMKLLQKGTEAAREVAANTLAEVKRAMGILYF
jgi:tryptophanyl-tRNA synthetase